MTVKNLCHVARVKRVEKENPRGSRCKAEPDCSPPSYPSYPSRRLLNIVNWSVNFIRLCPLNQVIFCLHPTAWTICTLRPINRKLVLVLLCPGRRNAHLCAVLCTEIRTFTLLIAHRLTETHTHTHPFNSLFSGTTQVSRHQKGKTNLDFTEARDSEWQWHQLGHMQICTSLQTNNHTNTPPLSFLQAGCPSCHPTPASKHWSTKSTHVCY